MKLLFDFLPIILFFVSYRIASSRAAEAAAWATQTFGFMVSGGVVGPDEAPVLIATVVVIVATLAQVGILLARKQKVDAALWVSLVLVVVLGGLTLWLRSETFIKWKPTLLYGVMALALVLGQLVWRKNLIKSLLGGQLALPDAVWARLLTWWIAFFVVQGALNLWVAYSFETSTWVNFKLFGALGLTLLFTLAQGIYLARHLEPSDGRDDAKEPR
jgi:intracellular septation protein